MCASIAVEFIRTQIPLTSDISLNSSQYVNHSQLECRGSFGFVPLENFSCNYSYANVPLKVFLCKSFSESISHASIHLEVFPKKFPSKGKWKDASRRTPQHSRRSSPERKSERVPTKIDNCLLFKFFLSPGRERALFRRRGTLKLDIPGISI